MALVSTIMDDLEGMLEKDASGGATSDAQADLQAAKVKAAVSQVADTIAAVTGRIIDDPKGTLDSIVEDTKVAIWGHNGPHPAEDAANFVKGLAGITRDNILKVYNDLSKDGTVKEYERLDNAVSKADGAVIESKFTTGASIGDMSWLIYKGRLVSNQAMQDKWTQYREVETSHGFNSRIFVN